MITNKETLKNKVETEFLDTRTDYDKGFLAGKSQAKKEILIEELEFLETYNINEYIKNEIPDKFQGEAFNERIKNIKQQLKKLGEKE